MRINFDATDWDGIISDSRDDQQKMTEAVKENVAKAALSAMRNIKIRMPVDTGAARSSWGSEGAAGIWRIEDDGMTNVQGSLLPYIGRLNEGSSKQAPAGFIDAEHEKAIGMLVRGVVEDLGKIIGS